MRVYRVYTFVIMKGTSKQFDNANCLDFYNQGTTNVLINGRRLQPDAGFGFTGFPDEIDQTLYEITFTNDSDPGNKVIVSVKSYI